jgi:hypothetical protein
VARSYYHFAIGFSPERHCYSNVVDAKAQSNCETKSGPCAGNNIVTFVLELQLSVHFQVVTGIRRL